MKRKLLLRTLENPSAKLFLITYLIKSNIVMGGPCTVIAAIWEPIELFRKLNRDGLSLICKVRLNISENFPCFHG